MVLDCRDKASCKGAKKVLDVDDATGEGMVIVAVGFSSCMRRMDTLGIRTITGSVSHMYQGGVSGTFPVICSFKRAIPCWFHRVLGIFI